MVDVATKILEELEANGDLPLETIATFLPKKFNDHRDFYPLAALISQGLVEDSVLSKSSSSPAMATGSTGAITQLRAWKLYATSTADKTATYKGMVWSIHGNGETLKSQRFALTGAGYLFLAEARIRRSDRWFTACLAISAAIIAAVLTSLL